MNQVIDWRSYFRGESDQSLYAKGAKGVSEAREWVPFADLHTNIGNAGAQSLEEVLRGQAVELWSDKAGRLFLVCDETDVGRLMRGESSIRRGECYTAEEVRHVVTIGDPTVVAEIHDWKRRFDGTITEGP